MEALSDHAEAELERHVQQRKEWNYHDIMTREVIADLAYRPALDVEPDSRMIFLGNLIVEKGHAEYDRVTSEVFQAHPVFRKWKNRWVAEEEPHGASMQEWSMVRGFIDGETLHSTTQSYLRNGLSLSFQGSTPFGLAFPALQEPSTKLTHRAVKDKLPDDEKEGRRIMSRIIADEERHERFFANMVRHALETEDKEIASMQMIAISRAVLGFAMPGIESDIEIGGQITDAYVRSAAYTIKTVAQDVLLSALDGEGVHGWNVSERENLDDEARKAQEELIDFTEALKKAGDKDRALVLAIGKARKKYGKVA